MSPDGLIHIAHPPKGSEPNAVYLRRGDHWETDDSFHPQFYSDQQFAIDGRVTFTSKRRRKILWTGEELDLWCMETKRPGDVRDIASEADEERVDPSSRERVLFSTDVPYLLNYLLQTSTYVYRGVGKLKVVAFDFEAAMRDMASKDGDILCLGVATALFDLEKLKFENVKKAILSVDDCGSAEILQRLDVLLAKSDFCIAHNIDFDYGLASVSAKNLGIPFQEASREKIYQGKWHGDQVTVPKYTAYFDTMLGSGIAVPRPPSYGLKFLVDFLNLREHRRKYISPKKIPEIWKRNPDEVIEYCLADIDDTLLLVEAIAPACFLPAMQAGVPVQWVVRSGIKSIWETLIMRRNVEQGVVIPHFASKIDREGRYANPYAVELPRIKGGGTLRPREDQTHVLYENAEKIDIGAAYANIVRAKNVSPETVRPVSDGESGLTIAFDDGSTGEVVVSIERGVLPSIVDPLIRASYDMKRRLREEPELRNLYLGFRSMRASVDGDELVFVRNLLGETRSVSIEEFTKNLYREGEWRSLTVDDDLRTTWRPVTGVRSHGEIDVYRISTRNGKRINVTSSHGLFKITDSGRLVVTELRDLNIGDEIVAVGKFESESGIEIDWISEIEYVGKKAVYDLCIDGTERFVCGRGGILVHNSSWGWMDIRRGQSRYANSYAAALETQIARDILGLEDEMVTGGICGKLVESGCELLSADTDGVYYVPPAGEGDAVFEKVQAWLSEAHGPYFSPVSGGGVDRDVLWKLYLLGNKCYLYLDERGRFVIKGSTLVSRSYPLICREGVRDAAEEFLRDGVDAAHEVVRGFEERIMRSDDPGDFTFFIDLKHESAYDSEHHAAMARKFGSGLNAFFVSDGAPKEPKPHRFYADIDDFTRDSVDRSWYVWHLRDYLCGRVLMIDAQTTGYEGESWL